MTGAIFKSNSGRNYEGGEKLGEVEVKYCFGGSLEKEETEGGGAWWGKYLGSRT